MTQTMKNTTEEIAGHRAEVHTAMCAMRDTIILNSAHLRSAGTHEDFDAWVSGYRPELASGSIRANRILAETIDALHSVFLFADEAAQLAHSHARAVATISPERLAEIADLANASRAMAARDRSAEIESLLSSLRSRLTELVAAGE